MGVALDTRVVYVVSRVLLACDQWYELMVAKLLFTNPLVTSQDYELAYAADWSKRLWQTTPASDWDVDKMLDAALRHDFMEVITLSRSEVTMPRPLCHTHCATPPQLLPE